MLRKSGNWIDPNLQQRLEKIGLLIQFGREENGKLSLGDDILQFATGNREGAFPPVKLGNARRSVIANPSKRHSRLCKCFPDGGTAVSKKKTNKPVVYRKIVCITIRKLLGIFVFEAS